MKNILIIIFAIACLMTLNITSSFGQLSKVEDTSARSKNTSLHIGDKIPDRFFKVNNYKDKQINLTDLKGKYIMLDLWGVYCGSCIEHMPDAEALQNKFKDSLQVILVSKNSDEQVKKVSKIADNVSNSKLPFVNGKDQLSGLFDFSYVPLYIWIRPDGIIKYITYDRFSEDTVKNIIAGKEYDFVEKKTVLFAHNDGPVMMNLYPLFGDDFFIYSYLAPHDDSKYYYNAGGRSSLGQNVLPKTEGGSFKFKTLYEAAYSHLAPYNPISDERVILNFNDTSKYAEPSRIYDYEIIVHKNIGENRVRKYMQNELDLFFNVRSSVEKRMTPCLVFKKINNGKTCITTENNPNLLDEHGNKMMRINWLWKEFFDYINFKGMIPPHTLIDQTGILSDAKVKFDISVDFNNLSEVNKTLEPYGLKVDLEERNLDCIVISDL